MAKCDYWWFDENSNARSVCQNNDSLVWLRLTRKLVQLKECDLSAEMQTRMRLEAGAGFTVVCLTALVSLGVGWQGWDDGALMDVDNFDSQVGL